MNKLLTVIITALFSLSTCNTMDAPLYPARAPVAAPAFRKAVTGSMPRRSIVDASSTSDRDLSSSDSDSSDNEEEWDRTVEGGIFEMSPPRTQKKASFDFVSNFMTCFVPDISKHMAYAERCADAFSQVRATPAEAGWVIQAITANLRKQKRENQQMALQCAHFALEYNPAYPGLLSEIQALEAKRRAERRARGQQASMRLLAALEGAA